jgi:hypothetical protein
LRPKKISKEPTKNKNIRICGQVLAHQSGNSFLVNQPVWEGCKTVYLRHQVLE